MAESSELRVSYQPQAYVEWKINNFFDLPMEEDYTLRSPNFAIGNDKWFLLIYTNGEKSYKSFGWIGLFLMKEISTVHGFTYRFGIKKTDGSELQAMESEDVFGVRWGTFKFMKRQSLQTSQDVLGPHGSLTIFCSVQDIGGPLACTTVEATSQTTMAESLELRVSYQPQAYVEWKIHYFFDLPMEKDYTLRSPNFSVGNDKWFLLIYTNGKKNYGSFGWIGLFLMKEISTVQRFAYRFGIRKNDGSELQAIEREDAFGMRWGTFKYMERQTLRTSQDVWGPHGSLTIFCKVRVTGGPLACTTVEATSQTPPNGIPTLIENFKELYLSKHCADVKITVKGKEFLAHKCVLTSRSTIFFSMFNNDMVEKNNGMVEITDCDQDTFEEFLLFLYTGMLDIVTPSIAVSLYQTADKYDVQELKAECLRCMINELTIDSFCDVIRLATIHGETDLLQAATEFFIENAKNILVTLKWQNFSAEYPSMGNELFLKFVHKYTL